MYGFISNGKGPELKAGRDCGADPGVGLEGAITLWKSPDLL